LVRRLIRLRREREVLVTGAYRPLAAEGDLLLFSREGGGKRLLVALNMGDQPVAAEPKGGSLRGRSVRSTECDRTGEPGDGRIDLRANEGLIIEDATIGDRALTAHGGRR